MTNGSGVFEWVRHSCGIKAETVENKRLQLENSVSDSIKELVDEAGTPCRVEVTVEVFDIEVPENAE